MLELFIKVISPFFVVLGLIALYSYATGQSGQTLLNATIDLVRNIVLYTIDVFNRG